MSYLPINKIFPSNGDDTTRLQNAINKGGYIQLASGTFSIDSQLTYSDTSKSLTIAGEGYDRTILDFSSAGGLFPDNGCIVASGTFTQLPNLATDLVSGSFSVSMSSDPNLNGGDVFLIWDATSASFNAGRDNYRAGEWMKAVSGSTEIRLDSHVYETYLSGNANVTLHKLNPVKITIKDLQVKGLGITDNKACIRLMRCKDSTLQNVYATGSQYALYVLQQSYDCDIINPRGQDYGPDEALNYGVQISNSQRVQVLNGNISTRRHAVTLGGNTVLTGSVPQRQILVDGGQYTALSVAALDAHGDSEDYQFSNLFARGGISLGGDKGRVLSCKITNAEDTNSRAIVVPEPVGMDFTIRNVEIDEVTPPTGSSAALVQMSVTDPDQIKRSGGTFTFQGKIKSHLSGSDRPILLRNLNGGTNDISCDLDVDIVRSKEDASSLSYVFIGGDTATDSYWKRIRVKMRSEGCGLYLADTGAEDIHIDDTNIIDAQEYGIRIEDDTTAGNFPWASGKQKIRIDAAVRRAQNCGIWVKGIGTYAGGDLLTSLWLRGESINNWQDGGTGSSNFRSSFFAQELEYLCTDGMNVGDDQDSPTQNRNFAVADVNEWYLGNMQQIGSLISQNASSNVDQVYSRVWAWPGTGHQFRDTYDTAAPTAGTWKLGDRCINLNPIQGAPLYWTCIVAGEPGTWSPFYAMQPVWLTPKDFYSSTNFPTSTTGSNDHGVAFVDFPDQQVSWVYADLAMPENYMTGSPLQVFFYTATADENPSGTNALIECAFENLSAPADVASGSFGVPKQIEISATGTLEAPVLVFSASQIDSISAGDPIRMRLIRSGTSSGDTFSGSLRLFRLKIVEGLN